MWSGSVLRKILLRLDGFGVVWEEVRSEEVGVRYYFGWEVWWVVGKVVVRL